MTAEAPGPILPAKAARQRFFLFFGLKLAGLAALAAGLFLAKDGITVPAALLVLVGAASIVVRPRHLGLTKPKP